MVGVQLVNSLEKTDFKTYHLSTSFRFNQDIANMAMEILKFKDHLGGYEGISIIGKGSTQGLKSKAILARTNLGLLLKVIEYVTEKKDVKRIYFEGNINSYTYADEGASLYDVLSLYNEKKHMIKDKLIRSMKNLDELEEYIEKTEDAQLGMMAQIVREYGNKIPGIIKTIKEKHVDNDEKGEAEMIFSTVHRCKGMEYDTIELVNDFLSEEKIEKLKKDKRKELNIAKLTEEINLLYVAVTRARNQIHIPELLMPRDFPICPAIHITEAKAPEIHKGQEVVEECKENIPAKAYSVNEVRTRHKDAYKPWTPHRDDELAAMYCEGMRIKEIAEIFGRTRGAISSRIAKLELEELYSSKDQGRDK